MRRCGVGAVIDAIRCRREIIDAQHLPVPAQAQLSRHGVDDYELVADIERDQGLRAVRSHQIDRRDFMVAGEAHDRGLASSEEHTSELQSLMRSSYAVFCLIKNTYQ